MACRTCNACDRPGTLECAKDIARVRSNIRQFQKEEFTVWRCVHCGTLHCLEDIDYTRYYERYPVHRQVLDFPTRRFFGSRLKQLEHGGLHPRHSILDYGCGNGGFIRFLKESGYTNVEGYDPFSTSFSDPAVLHKRFDVVISQDVLEHAPEPLRVLDELLGLVKSDSGTVVIGTPDATRLDLSDPLDAIGRLHQPYHRHILASGHLKRLIESRGFRVTRMVDRWFVDTLFPFLNSSFLFRYVAAAGGHMDAMLEPMRLRLIAFSPRLLFYGLMGGMINAKKDVTIFAKRLSSTERQR